MFLFEFYFTYGRRFIFRVKNPKTTLKRWKFVSGFYFSFISFSASPFSYISGDVVLRPIACCALRATAPFIPLCVNVTPLSHVHLSTNVAPVM